MDIANPGAAYPTYFRAAIERTLHALLAALTPDPIALPPNLRDRALHLLTFAFKLTELWPVTRDLVLRLAPKMEQAGHRDDWLPYLEQALQLSHTHADPTATAHIHRDLGTIYQLTGQFTAAATHFAASAQSFAQLGNPRQQAIALNHLAYTERLQRHYSAAHSHVASALSLLDLADPERGNSHFVLGVIAFDSADWPTAVDHLQQSLALWRQLGDKRRLAKGLRNLGPALRALQRYDEAIACYSEAIALLEEIHDPANLAITQMNRGVCHMSLDQSYQALELFSRAEPVFQTLHDELHLTMVIHNQGIAYTALQQLDLAHNALQNSLQRWENLGNVEGIVNALDDLGLLYQNQGHTAQAIATFQTALDRLRQIEHEPGYDHQLTTITRHLESARQQALGDQPPNLQTR